MIPLLSILTILVALTVGFVLHINTHYAHIRADIRLIGVIYDRMLRFHDEASLKKLSKKMKTPASKRSDAVVLEEIWIETIGNHKLRVLIMKPNIQTKRTNAVLWLHGGGLAMGPPESERSTMQKFVERNGAVVISPDYTYSIDAPYPAAINDCYSTLLWVKQHALALGIDEEQIFVGGGSAGGGLTAALSLMARDKGEVNIAFQMPLYPMINHTTIPHGEKSNTLVWDFARNEIAWKLYLGEYYGANNIPPYAVPMLAENFEHMPPTYTFVGTEDPFYQDTLDYVQALKDAGVAVNYDIHKNCFHGFDVIPYVACATQAWNALLEHYDDAVKNYRATQPQS